MLCVTVLLQSDPFSFKVFGYKWAAMILLYTSEFVLLLQSAVTSSVKTSEQFLWQQYIPMSPWFTDEVLCFGSWVVPFFLHTFFIPSVHKALSEKSTAFYVLLANCYLDCVQWFVSMIESILYSLCGFRSFPKLFTIVKRSSACLLLNRVPKLLDFSFVLIFRIIIVCSLSHKSLHWKTATDANASSKPTFFF